MKKPQNKRRLYSVLIAIILTYIAVKFVYALTGFSYSFSDGLLNVNLLIDLALWVVIFFPVNYLLLRLFRKNENSSQPATGSHGSP